MPVLDGRLGPTLVAFAMIALLGLVLRWSLRRGSGSGAPGWPPHDYGGGDDCDDFGLLAPVATLDTLDEAQRVRAALTEAGIKATNSMTVDGRHRVLVFSAELDRARRVAGGSS